MFSILLSSAWRAGTLELSSLAFLATPSGKYVRPAHAGMSRKIKQKESDDKEREKGKIVWTTETRHGIFTRFALLQITRKLTNFLNIKAQTLKQNYHSFLTKIIIDLKSPFMLHYKRRSYLFPVPQEVYQIKMEITLEQAMQGQSGNRGTALFFF